MQVRFGRNGLGLLERLGHDALGFAASLLERRVGRGTRVRDQGEGFPFGLGDDLVRIVAGVVGGFFHVVLGRGDHLFLGLGCRNEHEMDGLFALLGGGECRFGLGEAFPAGLDVGPR